MNTYLLPSRLDTANAPSIEKEIEPLICAERFVILDFSECGYLSSMGIRVLLSAKKKLMAKQGELFLTGVCPTIYGVLEMSGMTSLFQIKKDNAEAEKAVCALSGKGSLDTGFCFGGRNFNYAECGGCTAQVQWSGDFLAGYDELKFAVGTGAPADNIEYERDYFQPFVSTGRCVGFLGAEDGAYSDFRVAMHPSKAGVYLSSAVSFGDAPTGIITLAGNEGISLGELVAAAMHLRHEKYPASVGEMLCVITSREDNKIIIALAKGNGCEGGGFQLAGWKHEGNDSRLEASMAANLTIDNILDVDPLDMDSALAGAVCNVFIASKSVDCTEVRLKIETEGMEKPLELYKMFLARRIYTDSSRIIIKSLHGGFSAQTLEVSSFDEDGRRLRPTVMKVAAKNMIERESSRCQQYAQPYILNNSAQVLGTEFFGGMGALRYNFVGIGGNESELKWLTNYYLEKPYEELVPLFDKVFMNILQPWYGQGVKKSVYPFIDHDPTLTFFPQIFDTARNVLKVDSADKMIYIEEMGREALNPYWYLENVFPQMREYHFHYYMGICHGDLNMQNILIDEKKNVYLIDFSETKIRAAVSDFARLEAIMLVDNAPFTKEDSITSERYRNYAGMMIDLYTGFSSLDSPVSSQGKTISGTDEKNLQLTGKMRQYALNCVHGELNEIPYCFALLEWILPIVCYGEQSPLTKRLSMILSSVLMEKIAKAVQS